MNFTYAFCDIFWFRSLAYEVTSVSEGHTAFLFKVELRQIGNKAGYTRECKKMRNVGEK